MLGSGVARADDPPPGWDGTGFTAPADGATSTESQVLAAGVAKNVLPILGDGPDLSVGAVPTADLAAGCSAPAPIDAEVTRRPDQPRVFDFRAGLGFQCNGAYRLDLLLTVAGQPGGTLATRQIRVAAPGPPVTGVAAAAEGRTVLIRWERPENAPPDLLGYRVERTDATGAVVTLGDTAETSTIDSGVPEGGGSLRFAVRTVRNGPDGPVVSAAATSRAVVFDPLPGVPPAPGAHGTDGTPGAGRRIGGRLTLPSSSVSRLRKPSASATADTGFSETLPFGDREPGSDEPVLPADELASLTYEDEGRGLVVPIAVGLVLGVWALHLRRITRLARD